MNDSINPFKRLGIAPTLDRLRIKRAYFDAVARTPPHRDPAAFAEVRAAYEALMSPGGPEAACLLAPLDPPLDGLPYRERYGASIEEARQRLQQQSAEEAAVASFVELARRSTLEDLLQQLERGVP
jgi:curved DNA-binding protein CbpA